MKTTLIDKDLTLAVEDAIPASPVYTPEEILALAVCASPNGSTDPGTWPCSTPRGNGAWPCPTPSRRIPGRLPPGKGRTARPC
ncbi:hypothetical protein RGQ01_13590 [Akkermansia sp. EB-AMDK43]|uniref:hypothetical protein n=1 Tax=Akkermansia sp. EB-AMDK43 TaxID=3073964 RepID=UPI0028695936|nr:hypothetical protein [Akkermansia sp. EB-AMDK43]WMX38026.1 hypothetical protein RGQ01_13590 [Akkermansia sp. EB-AMDK43]